MEERLNNIENKLDEILKLLNKTPNNKIKIKTKEKEVTKSGHAIIKYYNDIIIVSGNTYSNKEVIKGIGGKWNKDEKGWQVVNDMKDKLTEIVNTHFDSSTSKEINKTLLNSSSDEKIGITENNAADIVNDECFIYLYLIHI